MVKATGLVVGDTASLEISFDPDSRVEPMHTEFKNSLEFTKRAKEAFAKLPPSRQKEINRYLNNIKSDQVRLKNIKKIVGYLLGKDVEYFVLLRNKK